MTGMVGVKACVFDAYGTLFDFASAAARFPDIPDDRRAALTNLWRDKQLQYTWLRSLQGNYVDFWQVTGDALDFTLDTLGLSSPPRRAALMDLYRTLTPFPEVAEMLRTLRSAGIVTAILSNGTPDMLADAVRAGGLDGLFDKVLSADTVRRFKTDPAVYQLALDELNLPAQAISFQSSNGWDAYGASSFGTRVVWCNRYGQQPERLPGRPDAINATLALLSAIILGPQD